MTLPGRPPARDPTDLEQRHLDLLQQLAHRASQRATYYDAWLEKFVLELREDGCSARSVARSIGVSPTTVQRWTTQARQRRAKGEWSDDVKREPPWHSDSHLP